MFISISFPFFLVVHFHHHLLIINRLQNFWKRKLSGCLPPHFELREYMTNRHTLLIDCLMWAHEHIVCHSLRHFYVDIIYVPSSTFRNYLMWKKFFFYSIKKLLKYQMNKFEFKWKKVCHFPCVDYMLYVIHKGSLNSFSIYF